MREATGDERRNRRQYLSCGARVLEPGGFQALTLLAVKRAPSIIAERWARKLVVVEFARRHVVPVAVYTHEHHGWVAILLQPKVDPNPSTALLREKPVEHVAREHPCAHRTRILVPKPAGERGSRIERDPVILLRRHRHRSLRL